MRDLVSLNQKAEKLIKEKSINQKLNFIDTLNFISESDDLIFLLKNKRSQELQNLPIKTHLEKLGFDFMPYFFTDLKSVAISRLAQKNGLLCINLENLKVIKNSDNFTETEIENILEILKNALAGAYDE